MSDDKSEGKRRSLEDSEHSDSNYRDDDFIKGAGPLVLREPRSATTLSGLFDETVEELTGAQLALESEAHKRLRRYKVTRLGVAAFMCLGVIATLTLNIQAIGLDMLATRVSPVVMTGALFFYILEALLRDHEVSWECAREANRLKSLVRRARMDWISRKAPHDQAAAVEILTELNDGCMRLDLLMTAEKVPPIQDILKKIQSKRVTRLRVQKS